MGGPARFLAFRAPRFGPIPFEPLFPLSPGVPEFVTHVPGPTCPAVGVPDPVMGELVCPDA